MSSLGLKRNKCVSANKHESMVEILKETKLDVKITQNICLTSNLV